MLFEKTAKEGKKELEKAIADQEFEQAAVLRDKIKEIENNSSKNIEE